MFKNFDSRKPRRGMAKFEQFQTARLSRINTQTKYVEKHVFSGLLLLRLLCLQGNIALCCKCQASIYPTLVNNGATIYLLIL